MEKLLSKMKLRSLNLMEDDNQLEDYKQLLKYLKGSPNLVQRGRFVFIFLLLTAYSFPAGHNLTIPIPDVSQRQLKTFFVWIPLIWISHDLRLRSGRKIVNMESRVDLQHIGRNKG